MQALAKTPKVDSTPRPQFKCNLPSRWLRRDRFDPETIEVRKQDCAAYFKGVESVLTELQTGPKTKQIDLLEEDRNSVDKEAVVAKFFGTDSSSRRSRSGL